MNEQDRFEDWFKESNEVHFCQFKQINGFYIDKHTDTCWSAWQAATAQAVPEGYVAVPIEPTNKMLNYGMDHFNGAFIEGSATGIASLEFAYKAMIKAAQENNQ